ncbi:MAG: hypothetical protein ACOX84_09555 [Methanothrix sp.]|uniref:winged helix-turn-helix domain-containing protein n=1 Tax=Methanothrix sp. TaxID=90426 RepID=UPI001BD35AFB
MPTENSIKNQSMRDPLQRLFLREKPSLALLALREMEPVYAAQIAKHIDSTFPHTSSILGELEEQGLIVSRPEGRIRYLELTDRGREVARALKELSDLLTRPDGMMQRLKRLEGLVEMASAAGGGAEAHLALGPLRRDLAKIMGTEDLGLREEAEALDGRISASLRH